MASIIVHELLHSIQACKPKRENICNYLAFRITGDPTIMAASLRNDWAEIERVHGIDRIVARFLSGEHCEEF